MNENRSGRTPLDDLATVEKANWDASWAANNQEEVGEAHQRLVTLIERHEAMGEIVEAVTDLMPEGSDVVRLIAQARALLGPE